MTGNLPEPPRPSLPPTRIRAAAVIGLGLVVGIGFILPVLAYTRTTPGTPRTVAFLLAAVAAVLLIRRLGTLLRRLLDSLPQPWRLPLLIVYALSAMAPPASLLLLQPQAMTAPVPPGSPPVSR